MPDIWNGWEPKPPVWEFHSGLGYRAQSSGGLNVAGITTLPLGLVRRALAWARLLRLDIVQAKGCGRLVESG